MKGCVFKWTFLVSCQTLFPYEFSIILLTLSILIAIYSIMVVTRSWSYFVEVSDSQAAHLIQTATRL